MKILTFAKPSESDANVNEVQQLAGGGVAIQRGGLALALDTSNFVPDSLWFIFTGTVYGKGSLELVSAADYVESRDAMASLQSRGLTQQVGFVYFAGTIANSVACFNTPTQVEGDFALVEAGKPRDVLPAFAPAFRKHGARFAAKAKLIHQLNPLDSLAAIENQMDIITWLLLDLAKRQPKDEQPTWLDALSDVIDAHGSVQDDPAAILAAITKFANYKAKVRSLQGIYFKDRTLHVTPALPAKGQ